MSNDPNHWVHFYQLGTLFPQPHAASESTVVPSTFPLSSSPPAAHANPGAGSGPPSLNPEGRVAKPARRRTRSSRRTPTTVMNTDTANFRAMVQQFTGGPPSAPFPGPNMLSFGFGHGQGQPASSSGVGHVQYGHQQQYQQYNNNLISQSDREDRHIQFSIEGIGSGPRDSTPRGAYHRGRSSSSDDNRGNNDYMY